MFRNLLQIGARSLKKCLVDVRGTSLIETLVAMGIMGVVAVAFLNGMAATSKAVMVSQERVTAESLAKSQIEYMKNQPYDEVNNPPQYATLAAGDIPDTYAIAISTARLYPLGGSGDDVGLQKLTVIVNRNGAEVFRLEGYRMDR